MGDMLWNVDPDYENGNKFRPFGTTCGRIHRVYGMRTQTMQSINNSLSERDGCVENLFQALISIIKNFARP